MRFIPFVVVLVYLAQPLFGQDRESSRAPDQKSLDRALCQAATRCEIDKVRELLKEGANPNSRHCGSAMKYGPESVVGYVFRRAKCPLWETVEALLDAGTEPNRGLYFAIRECDDKTGGLAPVKLFLAYGADTDRPLLDDDGRSIELLPIEWAERSGGESDCPGMVSLIRETGKTPPEIRKNRMRQRAAKEAAEALLLYKLAAIETVEKEGDGRREAGKGQEALALYMDALKETPAHTSKDWQIRAKIIEHARTLAPKAAVPDEAKRHADRAQAFLKQAQGLDGYQRVASELERALLLAPWWAGPYFNLGLMREKLGDPAAAIESLKLYLLASPNAQDAEEVRKKLIELEVAQELANEGGLPSMNLKSTEERSNSSPRRK